jgi:hypothetical protein
MNESNDMVFQQWNSIHNAQDSTTTLSNAALFQPTFPFFKKNSCRQDDLHGKNAMRLLVCFMSTLFFHRDHT